MTVKSPAVSPVSAGVSVNSDFFGEGDGAGCWAAAALATSNKTAMVIRRATGFLLMAESLMEEHRARARAVDLDVTVCAVCVLRVQVVLRTSRLVRADAVRRAVTGQAELG